MSGCGKSSVARAGVLPALQRPGETEWDCWRHSILRPSEATHNLLSGLAEALLKSLPELTQSGYNSDRLAVLLRDAPIHAIPIIEAALNHAAKSQTRERGLATTIGARLFVLIDQFEEVFTLDRFREEKAAFVAALAALSRSGLAWVVVTMRSDLYGHCTEIGTLMELKAEDGQYDLTPPGFAELAQMIRLPARAGGLRYEIDPDTGRKLDDVLLEEAWKNPESLPLLEFTLDELFKGKSKANVLTWQAYRDLGGMQGAIAKCAETEYGQLSSAGKEALPWVFGRLVTLEHNNATAQQACVSELATRPGASEVTQRFIAAKLFVTSAAQSSAPGEKDQVVVSMAHEALLDSWPLLRDWIENHRDNLKSHAAVTADTKRWIENHRSTDYLYRRGQPLDRAKDVLDGDFLSADEQEFVRASLKHVAELEFRNSLATGERMTEVSQQLRANYPELRQKIISEALASANEYTRAHVAMLLGTEPVEELTRELVRLTLNDPKDSVQQAAAASLILLDQTPYFAELTGLQDDGAHSAATTALAHVRVAADAVERPTSFEPLFYKLKARQRSRIIARSRVLRLRRGWPTLLIVLIPTVILSTIFTTVYKAFPGAFNYALCQAYASAPTASFEAIIASFFWGGMITFAVTFHRVVYRTEFGRKSFLQPWTALVAGAIGGVVSSALIQGVMTLVCNPQGIKDLGWINSAADTGGVFWDSILWQTRDFWPYMIMGPGLGIGMAAMANGLWASKTWPSFIGKQSLLTGKNALSLIKPIILLMVRFAWPIPVCLVLADVISFYIVRTAPTAIKTPAPAWMNTWADFFLGGMASHHRADALMHVREWKMSAWGQGLGIGFDSGAQLVGGFFCIVGMGLGLIAIRYGVKIEPRKN